MEFDLVLTQLQVKRGREVGSRLCRIVVYVFSQLVFVRELLIVFKVIEKLAL